MVRQIGNGTWESLRQPLLIPSLASNENEHPSGYALSQNYPHPFNPTTIVKFFLPEEGPVVMKIYDMLAREVRTVMDGQVMLKGSHQVSFDASGLASGAYFYRIKAGNGKYIDVKRMMIMK